MTLVVLSVVAGAIAAGWWAKRRLAALEYLYEGRSEEGQAPAAGAG